MDNISLVKPTIRRKEMVSVLHALVDEKIGPGDKRKDFNSKFLEVLGYKGAVTSFRTLVDALKIALIQCKVEKGSKVIVSALSPHYYKEAIRSLGAKEIIIDVEQKTGLLDYELAKEHFDEATAIIYYEPVGNFPINDEFDECNLPIIEDISESFLCTYGEKKAGDLGTYILYGLEEASLVSSAGGAVLVSKKYDDRKPLRVSAYSEIALCDLNAALASVQLSKLKENVEIRNEIYVEYIKALVKTSHRTLGMNTTEYSNSGYAFCVLTKGKSDDVISFAKKNKIVVEKTFKNRIVSFNDDSSNKYTTARSIVFRTVSFPIYPFLLQEEKEHIIKILSHLP